jgi:hypothetical protein
MNVYRKQQTVNSARNRHGQFKKYCYNAQFYANRITRVQLVGSLCPVSVGLLQCYECN